MVFFPPKNLFWIIWSVALTFGLFDEAVFGVKGALLSDLSDFPEEIFFSQVQNLKGDEKGLLMFDIDGTLSHRKDPLKGELKLRVKEILEHLCKNPAFDVYLNTGKSETSLKNDFDIQNLGWIFEHGAFYKPPKGGVSKPLNPSGTKWFKQTQNQITAKYFRNGGWPGRADMDKQKKATISFLAEKGPEFEEFFQNLQAELAGTSLVTSNEGTLIEITPISVNKGTAVDHLWNENYKLALAVGDDERDERMLESIRSKLDQHKAAFSLIISDTTKKTFKDRDTFANFKLKKYHALLRYLAKLIPGQEQRQDQLTKLEEILAKAVEF